MDGHVSHPGARRTNPVAKRASWVADRYPRAVLGDVLRAWAEANAVHQPTAMLRNMMWLWVTPVHGMRDVKVPTRKALLDFLASQVKRRPQLESTRFDRYLPWLAKALGQLHRAAVREVRSFGRLMARRWPEGDDQAKRAGQELSKIKDLADVAPILTGPYFSEPNNFFARGELQERVRMYTAASEFAAKNFGTIARWAADENVDLMPLTLESAGNRAQRWLTEERLLQNAPPGVKRYVWPDGWSVRELITMGDMAYEGKMMGHCVDDDDVYNVHTVGTHGGATWRLFSLRDPRNRPHATMEWNIEDGYASQLRGKGNMTPVYPYVMRMWEFRRAYLPMPEDIRKIEAPSDLKRKSDRFQAAYIITLPEVGRAEIEFWDGNAFFGAEVDSDIDEATQDLMSMTGQSWEEAASDLLSERGYSPSDNYQPTDLPPQYEFAIVDDWVELSEAEDELVHAILRLWYVTDITDRPETSGPAAGQPGKVVEPLLRTSQLR